MVLSIGNAFPHNAAMTTAGEHNPVASRRAIALIGCRGCGKSSVARALGERLGVPVVDTDELVALHAGRSITDIFAQDGEAGFRRLEVEAINDAVALVRQQAGSSTGGSSRFVAILSLGGGAVLDQKNVEFVRSVAVVVWLTAPPEVLWQRIAADAATAANRPPLSSRGGIDEIREILARREPHYRAAADFVVDTVGKSPDQIAAAIEKLV